MLPLILFNTALVATVAFALWKGGAPERIAAVAFLAAAGATWLVQKGASNMFHAVELDILIIDIVLLALLLALAFRADRIWPIWMVGFHGLTVGVHAAKAYDPGIVPWIYGLAVGKLAYPMLLLLIAATVRHRRRLTLYGTDPSWKRSSASLGRSRPRDAPNI
ncbi:hypothetical protein [Allosphingosinicella flava]|uniref:hypothetical protein n=1 Tax=Allosphingosinicella flava TaxID=2771430 RepID=UPI001CF76E94|nr:hypothetical protein [Sphingosinicella flava]